MKEKILYLYPEYSAFIKKDVAFLSRSFNVVIPSHNWRKKWVTPLNFLRQFLFLSRHLKGSRAVFVMFGGYWSFLPALAGKITGIPVYIIPGGTDCVSFPSLNYGSLRKPVIRTFIRWSFQLCSELLPVDGSLVRSDYSYYENSDYPEQGYGYFFPKISTPYRVIHNGFDPDYFDCGRAKKKPGSFIVVAQVTGMMRVRVKGIDQVLYLADQFSNCSFTIVGISETVTRQLGNIPDNVALHPFLPQESFKTYLAESEFVLQLSVSEGFPNALCEAMLCRCVPVGSAVGAIPHIIGDTGYLISSSNKKYLREKFTKIISTDSSIRLTLGEKARERVIRNFHISKREKAFLEVIERQG
jgi:glycosyltransferase involved in cell wall biosynthesis